MVLTPYLFITYPSNSRNNLERSFLFFSTFPYWIKENSVPTLAIRNNYDQTQNTQVSSPTISHTAFHISPLLANNESILKHVDLTKVVTGRFRMPLKKSFIDSIRFFIMWPRHCPLSYNLDHFSTGRLSTHIPCS